MSNIKKRVNLIQGKRIVVGDPNKVTKDEILLEEKNGEVSLKDNKGKSISGGPISSQASYYAWDSSAVWQVRYPSLDKRVKYFPYSGYYYSTNSGAFLSSNFKSVEKPADNARSRETSKSGVYDYGTTRFVESLQYFRQPGRYETANYIQQSHLTLEYLFLDYLENNYIPGSRYVHTYSTEQENRHHNRFTVEGLKATIREFMHTFSDVSSYHTYDSPIIGVAYKCVPYSEGVYGGKYEYIEIYTNSFYPEREDMGNMLDTDRAVSYLWSYEQYNTGYLLRDNKFQGSTLNKSGLHEDIAYIPDGQFSKLPEEFPSAYSEEELNKEMTKTAQEGVMYFIYDVFADTFYPKNFI